MAEIKLSKAIKLLEDIKSREGDIEVSVDRYFAHEEVIIFISDIDVEKIVMKQYYEKNKGGD